MNIAIPLLLDGGWTTKSPADGNKSLSLPKSICSQEVVSSCLGYTVLHELSLCNDNIESLFIKITNLTDPLTVGVVHRPPSGDVIKFNKEMEFLISKLPDENTYMCWVTITYYCTSYYLRHYQVG